MKKPNSGFTLIELVVSIVLILIVLSMLSPIIVAVMNNREKHEAIPQNKNIETVKCPQCGYLMIEDNR